MRDLPAGQGLTVPEGIRFNEGTASWRATLTVAECLAEAGVDPASVATAVNGCFVARSARASTVLQTGDHLTTFQAIVGG